MKLELINYTRLDADTHQQVLALRNNETIQQHMATQQQIDINAHRQFVDMLPKQQDRLYMAVFAGGAFIGGVSAVHMKQKQCLWGVFFDQNANVVAKSAAVYVFLRYLFEQKQMTRIVAEVKAGNENALSFNQSLGFEQVSDKNDVSGKYLVLELAKQKFLGNRQIKSLQKRVKKYEIRIKE